MRNLVVATAVAGILASSAAVADVSLSGHVRARLKTVDGTEMQSGNYSLKFAGSEDLGNGMTAFAQGVIDNDAADENDSSWDSDDAWVGLKGDFGTFMAGNINDFAGWACGDDVFQIPSGEACGVGATNGNLGNSIGYVGTAGDLSFGLGMRFNAMSDGSADPGDDTIIGVGYAAGDLSLGAQVTSPGASGADSTTVFGGTYAMGDMTFGLTIGDNSDDQAVGISLTMPIGSGSLKVGMANGDALAEDVTKVNYTQSLGGGAYVGAEFASYEDSDSMSNLFIGMGF